jgi:hypothetical protein
MTPFCFKKREELTILIDYYEDRISGTQAISLLNETVRRGIRLGETRPVAVRPTYSEGKRSVARARGLKGAEVRWKSKGAFSSGTLRPRRVEHYLGRQ